MTDSEYPKRIDSPSWGTSDGQSYADRYEAIGHQAVVDAQGSLAMFFEYLGELASEGRQRAMWRNKLEAWIDWSARMDAAREEGGDSEDVGSRS